MVGMKSIRKTLKKRRSEKYRISEGRTDRPFGVPVYDTDIFWNPLIRRK